MRKLTSTAVWVLLFSLAHLESPALDRPRWMDHPGIVMAGDWEEPTFRGRRAGRLDFSLPPDKVAGYQQEHSREMVARLNDLGVNFLMVHCYKGAGMRTEEDGMEDARRLAALAHKVGMRVGTYIGGTMLYERLFLEEPRAPQWQAFGPDGGPIFYNDTQQFRYAAVRNHPGFIEYLQAPTRYAIETIHTDLVHFDNFGLGAASYDAFSKSQFRAYLRAHGKPEADPPTSTAAKSDPLVRDWCDYKCQALTDHYAAMSRFIRSLNPKCAVECNPGGVGNEGRAAAGIDFARLLPLGNAFWDESYGADSPHTKGPGIRNSRIRSLKVARLYNNSAFVYADTPLEAAESMAFNLNCLGCVAWFEWAEITSLHEDRPILPQMKDYIRFFRRHQDLYQNSQPVADVAVLRTFADQNYGPRRYYPIEQALIEGHAAWRIIFDEQLEALGPYRVVVVPDNEWLAAGQPAKLAQFERRGGRVVRAAEVQRPEDLPATLREQFRILVDAPPSVALELCQQQNPARLLVHLVNYAPATTLTNIPIKLRLKGSRPKSARLYSPDFARSRNLPVSQEGESWACTLPELRIYAVLVVSGVL